MSSGLGLKGNVSRCFYYFEDFAGCMKKSDDPLNQCLALRNDYLECLHHKKEAARKHTVDEEEAAQKKGGGRGGGGHGAHGGH